MPHELMNVNTLGGCLVTRSLVEWCSLNIQCKRHFKQKQLYLHGPANTFKTSFKDILEEYCTSYEIPQGEDFYDLYGDPEPELCYLDEFRGKKEPGWLNLFLQGGTMNLRIKGGQRYKKVNPPVLILSNYSLQFCYREALLKNPVLLDPLLVRLEVIEIPTGVTLDIQGFREALAIASYAYTVKQGTQAFVSDLDLTNLISTQLMSEDHQETFEASSSGSQSPVLSRVQRNKRPLIQEEVQSTDLTISWSPNSTPELDTVAKTVEKESLSIIPTVMNVSSSEDKSREKFKKHRKTYDDYLLD